MQIVGARAYPFSIGNDGLPVVRAKMEIREWVALIVTLVLIASYTYSLGYKDGKREGYLQSAKWRKQVRNDS